MVKGNVLVLTQISTAYELETVRVSYEQWSTANEDLLRRMFTTDEHRIAYARPRLDVVKQTNLAEQSEFLHEEIRERIRRLASVVERLYLIPESSVRELSSRVDHTNHHPPKAELSKKVLVVHERDDPSVARLAALLGEVGLIPMVLHDRPSQPHQLYEDIDRNTDARFAFVLLSPEEVAGLPANAGRQGLRPWSDLTFRFGYLIGRLGRNKVCCLHTGDLPLPGEAGGLLSRKYVRIIDELAQVIARDLTLAGYAIHR
jgi:predicted nucleotide-binding protein